MVREAHPTMLALARESRGMTQAEVAEAMTEVAKGTTAVSQGYVSRAEKGRLTVSPQRLTLYGAALGYPLGLLCRDPRVGGIGIGLVHHRKRAGLSAAALRRVHAQLALSRLQVEGLLREETATHRFPSLALDALTTAKDEAQQVRRLWGLESGPVPSMTEAIEAAGGLVLARDLGTGMLDAVSQWDAGRAPLLLVNDRTPGDRFRFSLAHELAHLVLHSSPGTSTVQENEADAFAAEFLMPATDIRPALTSGVDLARLAVLKREWKVSMAALLRRARDLNLITEWHYRTLNVEMSALGYRTAEPAALPLEWPRRLSTVITSALADGVSVEELAHRAQLLPEDFWHLYMPHTDAAFRPASKVRP